MKVIVKTNFLNCHINRWKPNERIRIFWRHFIQDAHNPYLRILFFSLHSFIHRRRRSHRHLPCATNGRMSKASRMEFKWKIEIKGAHCSFSLNFIISIEKLYIFGIKHVLQIGLMWDYLYADSFYKDFFYFVGKMPTEWNWW